VVYPKTEGNKTEVLVVFVPHTGYMDHQGKMAAKADAYPFFESWQYFFKFLGMNTLSYDKLGTGASGGRMYRSEEASLLCLVSNINNLSLGKPKYLVFAGFLEGIRTLETVLPLYKKLNKGPKVLGVIQFGFARYFGRTEGGPLPLYALLGEQATVPGEQEDFESAKKVMGDDQSRVTILEGRDSFLCLSHEQPDELRCRVSRSVQFDIQGWIEERINEESNAAQEINLDE